MELVVVKIVCNTPSTVEDVSATGEGEDRDKIILATTKKALEKILRRRVEIALLED